MIQLDELSLSIDLGRYYVGSSPSIDRALVAQDDDPRRGLSVGRDPSYAVVDVDRGASILHLRIAGLASADEMVIPDGFVLNGSAQLLAPSGPQEIVSLDGDRRSFPDSLVLPEEYSVTLYSRVRTLHFETEVHLLVVSPVLESGAAVVANERHGSVPIAYESFTTQVAEGLVRISWDEARESHEAHEAPSSGGSGRRVQVRDREVTIEQGMPTRWFVDFMAEFEDLGTKWIEVAFISLADESKQLRTSTRLASPLERDPLVVGPAEIIVAMRNDDFSERLEVMSEDPLNGDAREVWLLICSPSISEDEEG